MQTLAKHASETCGGYRAHFIIDTGRNGNEEARASDCTAWCNLRGAGAISELKLLRVTLETARVR
eukprot:498901-Pleurochrysis_carterae.AAC.2